MTFAIAYVRSSPELGEGEIGMDAQVNLIKQFAQDNGYTLSQTVRERGGPLAKSRPILVALMNEVKKVGCPIIVAEFTRIQPGFNVAHAEVFATKHGVYFVSAKPGEYAHDETSHDKAARRKRVREAKSNRAKEAIGRRKRLGLPLGNTRNLKDAQRKGSASVKRAAELRFDEFITLEAKAAREGAKTAKALAGWLNSHGHKTANGCCWTSYNVDRTRGNVKARKAKLSTPPLPPRAAKPSVFSADRVPTAAGVIRIRAAMEVEGMQWGRTADLMSKLGFKRRDGSLGYAASRESPVCPALSEAVQKWVEEVEAKRSL